MKYKAFLIYLTDKGCTLHRSSGKHHIYTHPQLDRNIVIPKHHKEVSPGVVKTTQKLLQNV
jgi:predicted RNA binding protein YcfA (HicA-like mRNA interferase family)